MRFLDREWLRVVLLNAKQQLIKVATVSQGNVNESLVHPREVFKPAIVLSAYSFIMVHNHPSGDPSPSEADMRLTRRILEGSRLLQLHLVDHLIIGMPAPGRSSYFSFKEGGVIGSRRSLHPVIPVSDLPAIQRAKPTKLRRESSPPRGERCSGRKTDILCLFNLQLPACRQVA
jgi:proteasome lid subunit RPN8/RPN11